MNRFFGLIGLSLPSGSDDTDSGDNTENQLGVSLL